MTIGSLSEFVAAATDGTVQHGFVHKTGRVNAAVATTPVAGRMTSLWAYEGAGAPHGYAATPPTTAVALDKTSNGAMYLVDPTSGKELHMTAFGGNLGLSAGRVIVYDRLSHNGGLSGTATGAQTTNLPTAALTRYTSGVGVEAWLEIYTQIGVTGTTVTASYTNTVPTAGRTSPAVAWGNTGLREAQRLVALPYQQGDVGVRSVQSVTNAATTGTAGAFGVVLVKQLASFQTNFTGAGQMRNLLTGGTGPVKVETGACISFAFVANAATVPNAMFELTIVESTI